MANQQRRRKRVVPKGTPGRRPDPTPRYTPPIPREERVSPPWVPALMFTLLGLGAVLIVLNYLGLLPGGQGNGYLLLGLALITGGFITATQYH